MERVIVNENFLCDVADNGRISVSFEIPGKKKYRVSLKHIKEYPEQSQETIAFRASLYVNGKKAGYVWNLGLGGCNETAFDTCKFPGLESSILEAFKEANKSFDFAVTNIVSAELDMRDEFKKRKNRRKNTGLNGKYDQSIAISVVNDYKLFAFWV